MLYNSKIITFAVPTYIQFQNLLRFKQYFPKNLTRAISKTDLDQIPIQPNGSYTFESIKELYKIHYPDKLTNFIKMNNDAQNIYKNIQQAFNKYNLEFDSGSGLQILNDLRDYTHFENAFEDWNITHIVRKYKLDSVAVFDALITDAKPFNMGIHAYDVSKVSKFTEEFKASIIHQASIGEKTKYVDYWYGIGIKSHFPVNVYDDETPFKLSIRRLNERNNGLGFERIINMLNNTFETRITDYVIPEKDQVPILLERTPTHTYDEECDIRANDAIKPNKPSETNKSCTLYIWKYCIEQKRQGYFNHRTYSHPDKPATWDYMMREFYNKYVSGLDNKNMFLSIAHLFQFSENTISGKCYSSTMTLDPNSITCCSIVNMIIYGKVNINWDILERILPLIRVKFVASGNLHTEQLDNYLITNISYPGLKGPVYTIDWCDDNVLELENPKTDYEKLITAKALIRLMNEVPPELLNFNNYYHVCSWYHRNDMGIQSINSLNHHT